MRGFVRLLGLVDELDPKEEETKLLISLIHADFLQEAPGARLRVIRRLDLRVEGTEYLSE